EMRRVAAAEENAQQDDADERGDLDDREDVLRRRAEPDAETMQAGNQKDDDDRKDDSRRHVDRAAGKRGLKKRRLRTEDGKEIGHEAGEAYGQERDRAREGHEKRRPAREKSHELAVGLADVDVIAARVRQARRQFGAAERAGERERAA